MRFVMRFWKCGKCGQVNKTIALDDTMKCDFCPQATTIQLLGSRGSEPFDQVNRPTARAMITSA